MEKQYISSVVGEKRLVYRFLFSKNVFSVVFLPKTNFKMINEGRIKIGGQFTKTTLKVPMFESSVRRV